MPFIIVRLVNYIFKSVMCPAHNNKYTAHTMMFDSKNGSYDQFFLTSQLKRFTKSLSLQFESDSQLTPWNRNYISLLADFLFILYDCV